MPHHALSDNMPVLMRKFGQLFELTAEEIECAEYLFTRPVDYQAEREIVTEQDDFRHILIVESGWAYRYKLLDDGRRQILDYVLPGEIVGIHAPVVAMATHSVATLTGINAFIVETDPFLKVMASCPRLGAALYWAATREEAILEEQVVRLGRRSAYERIAHFFLELQRRLQSVGLAGSANFRLPLTQEMIADTLGLSVVHVNRTLARLRRTGMIERNGRSILIRDYKQLCSIAGFNSEYIDTDPLPRATDETLQRLA